jgi:hypothetical protein
VAPDTRVFVYPRQSQGEAQMDRDRYECNGWAVQQTGFDPSLPSIAPHQRVHVVSTAPPGAGTMAGAATGALIGAAVASPYQSGQGAVIGALAGTLLGAASEQAHQQQIAAMNQHLNAQADATLDSRAANFRRALSACLEGRGYTVR